MRHLLIASLFALLIAACGEKQEAPVEAPAVNAFSDSLRTRIADLQQARDAQALHPYTQAAQPKPIRLAAIRALASVQDSLSVPALIAVLADPDVELQSAAAYALGQCGHASAAAALFRQGQLSSDPAVSEAAWEALGKCGTEADLDSLLAHIRKVGGSDQGERALCAALYRFGARGMVRPGTDSLALAAIHHGQAEAMFWASAFLGRVRALGPVADPAATLSAFNRLPDADLQQLFVRRLGRCSDPACARALDSLIDNPKGDWRVRVGAIRAYAELKPATVPTAVMKSATDANMHVAAEAAIYLRDLATAEDFPSIHALATASNTHPAHAHFLAAAVRLARGTDRAADLQKDVQRAMQMALSPHERGMYFSALAYDPIHEAALSDSLLPLRPIISTAVMDALTLLYQNFPGDGRKRVVLLNKALESGDVALIGQAALLLRDPKAGLDRYVLDTISLQRSLESLQNPRDIETIMEVQRTLDHLAHRPERKPQHPPKPQPIDWALAKSIPAQATWTLTTSKGDISIRLHVEDAPATVCNITRLSRAGHFNGKYFHRVVANFVAQGGCPRGDGWGSTEPMIPSEWPGLRFSTGAVGMASAGKDTESCQFFITHSSTPHLDGRYTVFGYVTKGQDVVDRLQVGDRILESSIR